MTNPRSAQERSGPNTGDLRSAEAAFAVDKVEARDSENVAFDDGFLAGGTSGGPGIAQARDVADIGEVEALGAGNFARSDQNIDRRRGQVFQLVLGVKPREMERLVGPEFFDDPSAHPANGVEPVGIGRHHQVDDFKPNPQLAQHLERAQNGRELPGIQSLIAFLGEPF